MHKLGSLVRGGPGAAKARRTRKSTPRARNSKGWWYGFAKRVAQEDYEQRGEPPELTEGQVLEWADAFLARTGDWPNPYSGPILEAPDETWLLVAAALAIGIRGFSPRGSIPRLLDTHRGRYNTKDPKFTTDHVLAWADEWFERTGDWPYSHSGAIPGAGGINWSIVNAAFQYGRGMIPGPSSLARFLESKRGVFRFAPLNEEQILAWADAYHQKTGKWPTIDSGAIAESPDDSWSAVNAALSGGSRTLPGGSSLAELFVRERGLRSKSYVPPLTIPQILAWADGFHARTGKWPHNGSGPIPEQPGETWSGVDTALAKGLRGLFGGTTITRVLIEHRGIRSLAYVPPLTTTEILAWADAFHSRHGSWPEKSSGPVPEAPGENWAAIDCALYAGVRGLPGGSSLARLFAQERGKRYAKDDRTITVQEVLGWADAYRQRHGTWPVWNSGPVPEAPGESWQIINNSLRAGRRGLPEASSIARLLAEHRGRRHKLELSRFTIPQILAWADAFHERKSQWPTSKSGVIRESPDDTWCAVHDSLLRGRRGLAGGSTLAQLLAEHRGRRNSMDLPSFTIPQILAWADAFHGRTGQWPEPASGLIFESPTDTWCAVHSALQAGHRGLPGGSSLARLLADERGRRNVRGLPDLSIEEILTWIDAFHARTGRWPRRESGPVGESANETWSAIDHALTNGRRGLAGRSSLARLLVEHRRCRIVNHAPDLTIGQVLAWADAFHARTGRWPTRESGAIPESPGETWQTIRYALRKGSRGLPSGVTIFGLIQQERPHKTPS